MSMTQKELIDYCNGRDGKCSDVCLHNSRECDAFVGKYRCVPYLSNIYRPELYSDDVIEAEQNMSLEESDNKIPFGNASFDELDSIINAYEIHGNHKKVVELLKELAERRKQPEVIHCKDCENWDTTWQNDFAPNYHYCPMMDGTYSGDFYCGKSERRTDE